MIGLRKIAGWRELCLKSLANRIFSFGAVLQKREAHRSGAGFSPVKEHSDMLVEAVSDVLRVKKDPTSIPVSAVDYEAAAYHM